MKKEDFYRPLTILMPIVALFSATGVSVYEWRRLKRLEGDSAAGRAQISHIQVEMSTYRAQPPMEKYPTAPKTPREQALFLDALRANADYSGVQLVRWSNTNPSGPPPAPSADKSAPNPNAGSSPITSVVEVSGHAMNTRQFMYNVVRSRRLLNMGDIKWVRDTWPNTHLTFTLTRYVGPPDQVVPEMAQPARADVPASGAGAGQHLVNASLSSSSPAGGSARSIPLSLPNPMDAPGISHGNYQSRLEAGVSQLNAIDRSGSTASPRPPAVTNAKH